jgi:hypothetical protein
MATRMRRLAPPVIAGLVVLVALLGLIGTAIRDPHPHDLRVGLVGPAPAVQQITSAFATNAPGVFAFTSYSSEADARAAIDSRDIDAALLLGQSPHLVVAGAAGDANTGVITSALTNVFQAQGAKLDVEVVHPFFAGDAHGLVLFFVVVAVIISSLVVLAVLLATREVSFANRLIVVLAFAVLAGPIAMGTADWIAGDYGSGLWSAIGLLMLASAAVGAVVAGLVRLLGRPGFGLAALVVVLLDLVSSGGPAGSQFLPDFYRSMAPWMPAAQLYSGLRGALYFDGSGVGSSIGVLAAWLAGGLALMLVGELVFSLTHRSAPVPQPAH